MKLQRHLLVSAMLAGVVAFGASDALAWGSRCPSLAGVWVGCKAPGGVENCYPDGETNLVVNLQPGLFDKHGSIDADHDFPEIGNFQGNFKRTGGNSWEYELFAFSIPGKETCFRDEGVFYFDEYCHLQFHENIFTDGTSNIENCGSTTNQVEYFEGELWKLEVDILPTP